MAETIQTPASSEENLSKEFREYSVAEFFKKNRQMLGYSGKTRSLTTIVHEYVTNSLDACEDAGILPNITVEVSNAENEHLIVITEDNGTGIPKQNIGQALGMLLAGTKFNQRKQKRGQQGIGACMRSDTLVPLADGRIMPIKELVDANLVGAEVLSLDLDSFKIVPGKIIQCVRVKNPKFVRVKTAKGREIFLTPENPVLTTRNGEPVWIRADAVLKGERIAAPTTLKKFTNHDNSMISFLNDYSLQVDEPQLASGLFSILRKNHGSLEKISKKSGVNKDVLRNWFARKMPNGNPRGRPSIRALLQLAEIAGIPKSAILENISRVGRNGTFINIPNALNEDLCWLAGFIAGDGHLTSEKDDRWGIGISVSNKDKRLIDKFCEKMQGLFATSFSVYYDEKKQYYVAQTSSALVAEILLKLGLKRGRKFDSFDLSNALLQCEEKLISAYLRGLFDAEGSVCPQINAVTLVIYNKKALEKVFHALLRLGIFSSIQKAGDGQNRLMICGKEALLQFVKTAGFSAVEKNQQIISMADSIKKEYSPSEVVPGISSVLNRYLNENNVPKRALPSACKTALQTSAASRYAIKQALTACCTNGKGTALQVLLEKFAESEANWLEVLEVETVKNNEEFVYDLEVEKHHNFVANGLIAHNSYATLFAQITTGKPTKVKSGLGNGKVYECDLTIDVKKNEPAIKNEKDYAGKFKGLRVEAEFSEVEYKRGEYGVYEYLRRTAIANPHAQLTLVEPNKEITVFPRATSKIPPKPKATLPHPLGITTSDLVDLSQASGSRKIGSMLESEFTRISGDKVKELAALCPQIDFNKAPKSLQWPEAEAIVKSFQTVKWIAPDLDTMSPIGEEQIEKSLKNILQPEQMKVVERKPRVFRGGIPFMVEAAIAYGGKSGATGDVQKGEILRFANRTPLLFDAGTCAITEAVKTIDWARYDLKNWEEMPVSIFVNFTSVYVPYTGAGKLSISAEDELVAEIRFALMDSARSVSTYLHSLRRAEEQEQRRTLFFRYIDEVAQALHDVTGKEKAILAEKLKKIAVERTKIMEAQDEKEELEEVGEIEDESKD